MNDTQGADAEHGKGGKKATTGRTIFEYVVLAVVAIAVALLIQAFLVKPYRIPSESMENTLLIGDRVLVDRISWRFSDPQRQDIVVFHPPFEGPVLIKRIIGMPGDEIEMKGRTVYVNGRPLKEGYTQYIDSGSIYDHFGPYEVKQDEYFAMGDNRDNSQDSRFWGSVPREYILGRALVIYWSFETPRDEYLQTTIPDRVKQLTDVVFNFFTKTRWRRTFKIIR